MNLKSIKEILKSKLNTAPISQIKKDYKYYRTQPMSIILHIDEAKHEYKRIEEFTPTISNLTKGLINYIVECAAKENCTHVTFVDEVVFGIINNELYLAGNGCQEMKKLIK